MAGNAEEAGPGRMDRILSGREPLDLTPTLALVGPSGPLSVADLEYYRIAGPNASNQNWEPSRISHRHHRVCQLAAQGLPIKEIAAIVDYSPVQVSNILKSEAGRALREKYSSELMDRDMAFQARVAEVRDRALEKVDEHLEKGMLSGKELVSTVTGLMDRTGHGPSRTVDIHKKVGLDELTKELLEAHNATQARVISDPIDLGVSTKELEAGDRGLDMDRIIEQAGEISEKAGKADGGAKEGPVAGKSHRKTPEKISRFLVLANDAGSVD